MNKKIWTKPSLVVLYRGKPEEAVLAGCKTVSDPTGGNTATYGACLKTTGSKCGGDCRAPVSS